MHDATRNALQAVTGSAARLSSLAGDSELVLLEVGYLSRQVEALQRQAVADARAAGLPWAVIGEAFGVSRQAAQQRFR